MKLHRFYIYEGNLKESLNKSEDFVINDQNLAHQLLNVFRFRSGQRLVLFDGDGFDYACSIVEAKREVRLKVEKRTKNANHPKKEATLFQSIIKKDNFEFIAQKVTELGVSKIVPVLSERSEKKSINEERLRKILIEATEQSGRNIIPTLGKVVSLEDSLENSGSCVLAFHPEGEPFHSYLTKIDHDSNQNISLYIGPEGGWTENELNLFKKKGAKVLSFGPAVLRAETAAIVISALILL